MLQIALDALPGPLPEDAPPSAAVPTPDPPAPSPVWLDPEYANSNRGLATGLAGTSIAILTFAMFFLYDRVETGAFDLLLFQITIGDLLVATFLFGYEGTFFYWLIEADLIHDPRAQRLLRFGDVCFILGLAFLMIGPSLVLFTARLPYLGAIALVLWIGLLLIVLRGGRRSH